MAGTPWTPGPWAVDPDDRPGMDWNNHIVQEAAPHIRICFMAHDGDGNNYVGEANAHLVAAAPELYEACLDALFCIDGVADKDFAPNGGTVRATMATLRSALAKAKSGVPSGSREPVNGNGDGT